MSSLKTALNIEVVVCGLLFLHVSSIVWLLREANIKSCDNNIQISLDVSLLSSELIGKR